MSVSNGVIEKQHNMYHCMHACKVASVMSDSVRPYGQQPTRPFRSEDSLGKNAGVGCHFLLQMCIISAIHIMNIHYMCMYYITSCINGVRVSVVYICVLYLRSPFL